MEGVTKEMNMITNYNSKWDDLVESLLKASNEEYHPQYDENGNEVQTKLPKITDYVLNEAVGFKETLIKSSHYAANMV